MNLTKEKFSQMSYETLILKSEQLLMTIEEDLDELKENGFDESLLDSYKQKLQDFEQNEWDLNNKILWSEAVEKRDETLDKIKLQLRKIASFMLNINPNGKNFNAVYGLSKVGSLKREELILTARAIHFRLKKELSKFTDMGLAPEVNQNLGALLSDYIVDSTKEFDAFKQRKYATICRHEAAVELLNMLRKLSNIGIYTYIDVNNAKASRYFIDSGGGKTSNSSTTEEQAAEIVNEANSTGDETIDFVSEPQSSEMEA